MLKQFARLMNVSKPSISRAADQWHTLGPQIIFSHQPLGLGARPYSGLVPLNFPHLSKQAKKAFLTDGDRYGDTALISFAVLGKIQELEYLLQGLKGFDTPSKIEVLNHVSFMGDTALTGAAAKAQIRAIKLLRAVLEGCSSEEKMQVLACKDNTGRTPLMVAVDRCSILTLGALLRDLSAEEKTQMFTQKNNQGQSVIDMAMKNNDVLMIELLTEFGATFPSQEVKTKTPN